MGEYQQLAIFRLDEQQYALPLNLVERVVNAVELTPLPEAPRIVLGVINVGGSILPVLNMRQRCGLSDSNLDLDSHFLIAKAGLRRVVLVIDEARGVIELPHEEIVAVEEVTPNLEHVSGFVRLADGLLLIYDLESFLSLDEERALDRALSEQGTFS